MKNGKRICLDSPSATNLSQIASALRALHCRMNASELGSEIVNIFFEKYFEGETKSLEKKFFDEKLFLAKALRSKGDGDIEASLRKILKMKSK